MSLLPHSPPRIQTLTRVANWPSAPASCSPRCSRIGRPPDGACWLVRRSVIGRSVRRRVVLIGWGQFWLVKHRVWIGLSRYRIPSSPGVGIPIQRHPLVVIGGDRRGVIRLVLPGVTRRVVGVLRWDERTSDAPGKVTCPVRWRVGDGRWGW